MVWKEISMGHVLKNKIHEFSFTTHFMGHCKSNLSLTSRIREIFSVHLGSCFFLIKAVWGGHWVDGGTLGEWGDTGGQISFGTLGPAEQQYKDRHSGQKRQETGRTAGRKH